MRRVLIFGAGYSGRAIGRALAPQADFLAGTTRSADNAEALSRLGIRPLLYAGEGFGGETKQALQEATHLIISIAPGEGGDPVLADLRALSGGIPNLEWVGYLSTVGVYGDHGGAWVDEESECRPSSSRSRQRLEAEDAWLTFGRQTGVPVAILRLPGIYGPGRNAFVNFSEGTARRIVKPGQVFNRIHVEDIAGATRHLMRMKAGGIFNLSDEEPAPAQDVVAYAARLMGMDPPPEVPFDQADLSPMGRSFYSECKRVSNGKLKASGYELRYPNYRHALEAIWKAGDWRGESAANML
ncbi:SDR family oxidoreductase [Chelativorans sp. AA-79]|uniref:SDR family oxidoreductase n=1 Tax=Chelativorans sp. AA-79 TaxID=3028735 RepID=UPI0023F939B3|nr:SDR family oxidoreductase [Chelativorans sp. AA-79]WEX09500.1 SDR family oxidoreductase [Chelativorans sp. AA-79]